MPTKKAAPEPPLTAALLSPPGEGGISVIALWGPAAASFAAARVKGRDGRMKTLAPGRLTYGFFCAASGDVLDEVIAASTDTGCVEINCHGGALPARRILHDLAASGVTIAKDPVLHPPGRRSSLVEREALRALFSATTDLAARVFAAQSGGCLQAAVAAVAESLRKSSDNIPRAAGELEALLQTAPLGMALAAPASVAVMGPANAGKSTLVNALAGYERNIVTDVPGTTRDAVRVPVALFGIPVTLVDTAGAVPSPASLDKTASLKAAEAVGQSAAALIVIDASAPLPPTFSRPATGPPAVVALNKIDLATNRKTVADTDKWDLPAVRTSALTAEGLPAIRRAVLGVLGVPMPDENAAAGPVIFTERQSQCAENALEALRKCNAQAALAALGALINGP